ncbi:hypothetical protein CXB51_031137 [Gossypium anomalum]|uniref:Integrase catalytic domain-containing protein n=1 Tax=Gossypium anomalum TaxID=47600 RepID=A0A8J5Y6U9_9ROSI|nr:hypothetical protein CXB51_031137 [Gossypium anomalum]
MKQRLYAHRLEEGASVHEHLTVFKEILSNLESIEVQYDKEDLGLILLYSLPPSYSTFRDTILYSRESLTVDKVYDSLTSYDKMKHFVVKPDSQGESLIPRGRQDQNADNDRGRTQEQNPRCIRVDRSLQTEGSTTTGDTVVASSSLSDDDTTKLWHMRLRHMSENGMKKRVQFTKGIHNMKGTLEYIPSNLWGPSRVPSRGGANYMLTFIDDFSIKTGKQIKYLRTDNGLEFCSDEFNRLCKSEGIVRHLTVRHTPQKNDIVERMNRTIMEKVRCMLSNANLSKSFWAEAAFTACFLINRSPSVAIEKKTPQEEWFGNLANYSDLKIFKCPAYTHVDNGKLEPRAIKCVFLGYKAGVKGYKLWCPGNRKVVEHQINTESTPQASTKIENIVTSSLQYSIAKNRTRREIKLLKKYAEADLVAYALNVAEDIDANQEPSNYSEVFKKKEGTPGVEEPRYKARLVAKGYSQIPGVNFIDVFSPVVKHSSIRALLGIVAMHDLELEQLDVKTTFLHREFEEDIYMQQPEGFIVSEKEDYVCLLKKSLYSLKQSPRQWYKRFDSFITSHDFKRSSFDNCIYFKKNSDDDEIEYMSHVPYSSAVGSLMYAIQIYHMQSVQLADIWRIPFGRTEDRVIGYVDADFAGDLDRRRSLTRYVFTIGGCAISWKATLQTTVTLSTTEAEYMAITEACKEAIWLKGLFSELNEDLQISTVVCESQSAIFLAKDQMFHERIEHIDVR